MKLNNKGFAISSIMYIILVLAVVLIVVTLAILSSRKLILDKLKDEVLDNIYGAYDISYRDTLALLKEEAITYATTNNIENESVRIGDFDSSIESEILESYKLSNKYLTIASNDGSYNVFLGKEKVITDISKPIENMLGIVDYKIGGNSVQAILPGEYQQVEYIESSGTQYIDTGIMPNHDTGFDITFLTKNEFSSSTYGSVMGAREDSSRNELQLTTFISSSDINYQGTLRFGNTNTNAKISTDKTNVKLLNSVYTGSDGSTKTFTQTFTSPVSLTLFALNNNGTVTQYGTLQLYNLKLYDGSSLIRDFIPCYRKSDSEIGLYDLVEDKFYTNLGTGEFTKGSNAPTPEAPVEVRGVGDKTKNLFDESYFKNKSNYEIIWSGGYASAGIQLKPNTTYTIQPYKKAGLDVPTTNFYYKVGDSSAAPGSCTNIGTYVLSSGNFTYSKKQVTTGDDGIIYFHASGNASETVLDTIFTYFYFQVVEGTTVPEYEPYGYRIPITIKGKQLVDKNNLIDGYIKSDGTVESVTWYKCTDFIEISGDYLTYSNSASTSSSARYYVFYDVNKEFISGERQKTLEEGSSSYTLKIPSGAKYFRYNIAPSNIDTAMVELGDNATDYEAYQAPKTTYIYLNEPLMKIQNSFDSMIYNEQNINRQIGKFVFQVGAVTQIRKDIGWADGYLRYYTFISNRVSGNENALSNSFVGISTYKTNKMGFRNIDAQLEFQFDINLFGGLTTETREELFEKFKEYINNKETPIIAYYGMKDSENVSTNLEKINTLLGNQTISVDTTIQPSNVEFTIIEKIRQI